MAAQEGTAPCSGLTIANQTPSQSGTPGHSGSWSFTVSSQNCTGGDLHAMKIQGGTAGWLSVVSTARNPNTGTVTTKPNGKVVSWSFP